jgi:hypothetical protein
MAVASMAFPSAAELTHTYPKLRVRNCATRQLLFAGGSAAAEDFCTPQGMALAKHFE